MGQNLKTSLYLCQSFLHKIRKHSTALVLQSYIKEEAWFFFFWFFFVGCVCVFFKERNISFINVVCAKNKYI